MSTQETERKEIKLSITWPVIHSQYQWAFCSLLIEDTFRMKWIWLMQKCRMALKHVVRGANENSLFVRVEDRELHSHSLVESSRPLCWWLRRYLHSVSRMLTPNNFFNWNYFMIRGSHSLWIRSHWTMQPLCSPSGDKRTKCVYMEGWIGLEIFEPWQCC